MSTSLSIYQQFGPLVDFILSIHFPNTLTSCCIDRPIHCRTRLSSNDSIFFQWIYKIIIYNFSLQPQGRNPFPTPLFNIYSPQQGHFIEILTEIIYIMDFARRVSHNSITEHASPPKDATTSTTCLQGTAFGAIAHDMVLNIK